MTELVDEWRLRPDGDELGTRASVRPVRTADGRAAVLKIGASADEHLALTRWDGDGAVRLLRADPRRDALLLDRIEGTTLADHWDLEACEIVAGLYRRLHRPTGTPFRTLSSLAATAADQLAGIAGNAPLPRRMVEHAAGLARAFAADEATDGVLVHGDLHYEHVVTDGVSALAISPAPLSGEPAYEVAPLLWHRADELGGDVRGGVRRRFHTTIDAADIDEDRARDWVIVRSVLRAVSADPVDVTHCIAVVKAVQD